MNQIFQPYIGMCHATINCWGIIYDNIKNNEDETNTEDDSNEHNYGEAFLNVLQSIAPDKVELVSNENKRVYNTQEIAGFFFLGGH